MSFIFSLNFEYKLSFPHLDLTTAPVLSPEFSGFFCRCDTLARFLVVEQ